MILLTGASGFIGQHLLKALVKEYGQNGVIALSSTLTDNAIFVPHLDYTFESNYLAELGYDQVHTIIHAGAFTPKSGVEANDMRKSNSNIGNTERLLGLTLPKLRKVILFSTLDVYENTEEVITEDSPVSPQTLYGHSKYYCESMVQAWCSQHAVNKIILRIGHVYGPGEHAYKKLIPEVMRTLIKGEVVKIWGTGDDIRSFIYIDDVVDAILASLRVETIEGPVNIVSDTPITIKKVVQSIIQISGRNTSPEHIPSSLTIRNLRFDNSKMKQYLHVPRVSLLEGLQAEWEAFQSYHA